MQDRTHATRTSTSSRNVDGGEHGDTPSAKRRRKGNAIDELLAKEVGHMRDSSGAGGASFVGSASGIHFIRSVYGTIGTRAPDGTSPGADLVPGEDDRLAPGTTAGPGRVIWYNNEIQEADRSSITSGFTFDDLMDLTESFFDAWHPAFPLLHAPSILKSFERLTKTDITNLDSWEAVTLKAIISISLADRRQLSKPFTKAVPRSWIFTTFEDAHESLLPALARSSTIPGIQAVVCVQLFLVSMLRLNTASRLTGLIVQMAYQLGLHRCPRRYKSISLQEAQLRKRIFWSVYCLERYVCQAMGLPLALRDEDIDVCHLHDELHMESKQDRSIASSPNNVNEALDPRLQLLVFLSKHAQIRGAIMELRNKRVGQRDASPEAAVFIGANLAQWWNEVEDCFDQSEPSSATIHPLHKVILETMRHESIIMLNRPLLALPKHTANYAKAIQSCISSAKSLLTLMYSLHQQKYQSNMEILELPMMWPSFTWSCWMSAFVLLYAAAESMNTAPVVSRYVDRSLEILKTLASRGSMWPNACAVAIQDLKTLLSPQVSTALGQPNNNTTQHVYDRQSLSTGTAVHQELVHSLDLRRASSTSDIQSSSRSHQMENVTNSLGAQQLNQGHQIYLGPNNGASSELHHPSQPNHEVNKLWSDFNYLPINLPPTGFEESDPLQGFDIPFWFGQDNYLNYISNGI